MEQRVIAAELSAVGAQELLEATSSAHLAYTAGDGTPRVIPVAYFWTGTEFVVWTEHTRALSVRGRASIEIIDGLVPEYLAAARKSMGAEAAAEFEKNCREMYDQMARIAIVPTWVRFYDFGTRRVPQFLKDLAERNRS